MTKTGSIEQENSQSSNDISRKYEPTYLRWAFLVGAILVVNFVVARVLTAYVDPLAAKGTMLFGVTVMLLLLLYAILLAIPFFPGVEIGVSLLIAYGSEAAPFVYVATFVGLLVSYFTGIAFSKKLPCWFLKTLGLHRACAFVDNMKELDRKERLKTMEDTLPSWVGRRVLKRRYLMIGLLINLPGNSFIGGGGGIAMAAGLSRLFSTCGVLVVFALAVAPIPALVYVFGSDLIR